MLLLAAAGCGGGTPGEPDVMIEPPVDAAPVDVMDVSGEYDDPSDFDPLGCESGTFTGLDPTGIWHHDVHIAEFGDFPGATRFDPVGLGFTAAINARPTDDVRLTDDYLFVRLAYDSASGDPRVRTYYACARAADGSLTGKVAFCQGGGCLLGTFLSVQVRRLPGEAESQGLSLVSEWSGDPAAPWPADAGGEITVNVRVAGGVAYVARYVDGLRIVDVSNPAAPSDLGWSPVALPDQSEIYNDVKIVDGPTGKRYALMGSSDRGVVVIDVTDPSAPAERGTFPPIPAGEDHVNVHTLFTETRGGVTRAYLANTTTVGLDVWDVTDPEAPAALGSYVDPDVATDFSAYLHDLYVQDGLVYLNYWGLGFIVVDANDPAAIAEVGQFNAYERRTNHSSWVTTLTSGRKVAVVGDEDFTAHVRIIDVDPAAPTYMQMIGELSLRPEVSVHNIMAFGDRAYISWYQDGIRIVDLADPATPTVVAYFNTWDGRDGMSFYEGAIGLDVDLNSGLVYAADTARGLLILDETP